MFDDYLDIINEHNTTKRSKYNYIYKTYLKNPNLIKDLNKFRKETLWMDKCTMLLINNKVEHNCKEINCNIDFVNKNGQYEHLIGNFNSMYEYEHYNRNVGIFYTY
jgi:hypothetical protein